MPDARAVRLWEKIKTNLVERDAFDPLSLETANTAEVDAEQIAAIEHALGVGQVIKEYGAPDSTAISFKVDKKIPSAPVIEAMSNAFFKDGGHAFINQNEAMTIEYMNGRLNIAKRPKTW